MVENTVTLQVEVYLGSVSAENLFCSATYESQDFGQTVEISKRVVGSKGRESILSDYEVNLVIEAALSENDVDYSEEKAVFLITLYSAEDIANDVVSAEDAAYSAILV